MTDTDIEKAPETTTWDDVRRVRDELRLKLHLAGMEAREQWEKLQPRLAEIEHSVESGAQKAGTALSEQASSLGAALRKLLGDITSGGDDKDGDKAEKKDVATDGDKASG
jgi:hypothetical protein